MFVTKAYGITPITYDNECKLSESQNGKKRKQRGVHVTEDFLLNIVH